MLALPPKYAFCCSPEPENVWIHRHVCNHQRLKMALEKSLPTVEAIYMPASKRINTETSMVNKFARFSDIMRHVVFGMRVAILYAKHNLTNHFDWKWSSSFLISPMRDAHIFLELTDE